MLTMILNDVTNKPIHITSISRNLDTANSDIHFVLNGSFGGDYEAADIENLAEYEDNLITKVQVYDNNNVLKMQLSGEGHLISLSEVITETESNGYFNINM